MINPSGVFFLRPNGDSKETLVSIQGDNVWEVQLADTSLDIKGLRFSSLNKFMKETVTLAKKTRQRQGNQKKIFQLMNPMTDMAQYVLKILTSTKVRHEIEKFSNCSIGAWIESDVNMYFEVSIDTTNLSRVSLLLSNVEVAMFRAYSKETCVHMVYFQNTLYITLRETNSEQSIELDYFPDITSRGCCFQLRVFTDEDTKFGFRSLALCSTNNHLSNVMKGKKPMHISVTDELSMKSVVIDEAKLVSQAEDSFKGGYTQTYLLTRAGIMQFDSSQLRRALFRFGNWCYEGDVLIESQLNLHNVPLILRQFQKQQGKLRYTHEARNIPLSHPFHVSLSSVTLVSALLKEYILKSGRLLHKLEELQLKRNANPWIDIDSGRQYFELQVTQNFMEEYFRNIDFLACKIYYHEIVFILLKIPDCHSFYVTLNEARGDQPLLDLSFPDVSTRNRGYLLYSFNHVHFKKLMVWECNTSIWKTSNRMVIQQQKIKGADKHLRNENHSKLRETESKYQEKKTSRTTPESRPAKDKNTKQGNKEVTYNTTREEKQSSEDSSKARRKHIVNTKTRAPHHVKSMGKILRKQSISKLPSIDDAPWDEFGRPKAIEHEGKEN